MVPIILPSPSWGLGPTIVYAVGMLGVVVWVALRTWRDDYHDTLRDCTWPTAPTTMDADSFVQRMEAFIESMKAIDNPRTGDQN